MQGDIPGRFVWRDERCVAFLSIHPLRPGHALLVPVPEVDHWIDLDGPLLAHLMLVAQTIGKAQQAAFKPVKVGLMAAGLEVPHVHFHLVPIRDEKDLEFARADTQANPADLDRAADELRAELRRQGAAGVSD